jgi:hypothetical protein
LAAAPLPVARSLIGTILPAEDQWPSLQNRSSKAGVPRRSHFHQGIRKQGMTRQVDLLNWRGRSLHR